MTEEVSIKINLSSTNWEFRYPGARVYINDKLIFENIVENPVEIVWSGTVKENNKIIIEMYNKIPGDTTLDNDGNIVNDVLINIDNISIDDIDLDDLLWTKSTYYPDDNNAPSVLHSCVNLGWNGRWELEFSSPTYLWFLKNLEADSIDFS